MTREEAIIYLKRADVTVGQEIKTKTAEALEMAIEALKAEPCEDMVSRQAVLEITVETGALETQARVKSLPPVTPKQRTGKWLVYVDCEGKTRQCVCNQCGYKTSLYTWKNPNFCEKCGAKMEGESE